VDLAAGGARLEAGPAVLALALPPEPRPAVPTAAQAGALDLQQLQQALILRRHGAEALDLQPAGGRRHLCDDRAANREARAEEA